MVLCVSDFPRCGGERALNAFSPATESITHREGLLAAVPAAVVDGDADGGRHLLGDTRNLLMQRRKWGEQGRVVRKHDASALTGTSRHRSASLIEKRPGGDEKRKNP